MKAKKEYIDKFVEIASKEYIEEGDRDKKVLEIFSKLRVSRFLDVGCGDATFTVLIAKACQAEEVYGIEISEKGVELARRKGVKCFQLDVDVEKFPFSDNYFDAVFAGEIIEHLYNPDLLLAETYRVLKPKGIFVLTTPNLASIHNRIALLLGFQPFNVMVSLNNSVGHLGFSAGGAAPDHIRFFTLRSLKELLKIHKFEILEVRGSCAMLPENMRFKKLFKAVDKFFAVFPSLAYRSVVICRKKGT